MVGHRGATHSFLGCVVATVICFCLGATYALPFEIGFLTHLAGDVLTVGGCAVLWPLTVRPSLSLWRTGARVEVVGATVLGGCLLWWYLLPAAWPQISLIRSAWHW